MECKAVASLLEQIEKLKQNPQLAKFKALMGPTQEALKLLTGKEFKRYEEWEEWWGQNKDKFEIPE